MDREDVIRMAQESGWSGLYITWAEPTGKPDWSPYKETLTVPVTIEQVERFAALVAAAERERCAKVCDDMRTAATMSKYATYSECMNIRNTHSECAAAIRALT